MHLETEPAIVPFTRPARPPRLSRSLSLLASIALHVLAVFLLWSVPEALRESETPAPEIALAHQSTPLIWYPPTVSLPEIAARLTGNEKTRPTRKTQAAPQTIATEYKAPAGEQVLWHPKPEIEIHHDIESPNIVSLPPAPPPATSPPTAEPRSTPEPIVPASRTFVAPAIHREIPAPARNLNIPAPPAVDLAFTSPQAAALAEAKLPGPPAKRFFAPKTTAKTSAAIADRGMVVNAPPQLSASKPDANLGAVIGLHPSLRTPPPPPKAVREARISAGDKNNGGIDGNEAAKSARAIVPGVNVGAAGIASPPGLVRPQSAIPASPNAQPSSEQARAWEMTRSTALAPLRASSRIIPRALEARFGDRTVYAVALPMLDDSTSSGDWTLWFSDLDPTNPGATYVMRAPVPSQTVHFPSTALATRGGVVQLSAMIRADGSVDSVTLFKGLDAVTNRAAIAALQSCRFLPALHNNTPIAIEAIVEVPFQSASSAAR